MRREYPAQPIVGAGVIIVHDGRLVLVKRGVEPGKGRWSIPGGAVDLGEGVREAALREAEEECGLNIEIVNERPMDAIDSIYLDEEGGFRYHYVLLQFLARPVGGRLKPSSDALDAKWVPLEIVETYPLTKSFRSFFEKHRQDLENLDQ
ncbi:NUDIX domain-containing protein [Candidatus Bathyarchaeota archaeon]|nr:NUDIX hydrolase [Candidatus Bathyarchaeota archaeon]NIU80746.1 NUDIX domain-containing protein [Candidatus Bathyarchaeota archaeon]NIV67374.1 NUDIX domain-containing protein [Candidatus Bathyarchaeota archaeon]NIW34020.1 NUDIX domain-containing protein [Candidatus Bathyarchaeota archaeon]